jgi:hypothetical protein
MIKKAFLAEEFLNTLFLTTYFQQLCQSSDYFCYVDQAKQNKELARGNKKKITYYLL